MLISHQAIHLISKVMKKHECIDLPAKGTSMFPFIREGDVCTFITCSPMTLEKGDIVLFHTVHGQLVTHRFYYRKRIGQSDYFMFKGDSNLGFDEPITEEQVIGKLIYIKKNGRRISANSWISVLWSKAVLSVPYISSWLRKYIDRKDSHHYT